MKKENDILKIELEVDDDSHYILKENASPNLHLIIRKKRKEHKYTQEEMAKILHVSRSTYKNYEMDLCEPSISTLVKMADVFRISLDELVGRPTSIINKMVLSERQQTVIDKVMQMNDKQIEMTELFIDTMMNGM